MKRIILLSDGTGNAASEVWRTNVWRIFKSLDLTGSNQVAIYDDGVGTSSFKPLAILGGAFGWGLKRNILDLYKFVCRNYQSSEDEIFGFRFSRGAFTMRMVVGLIISQGLVRYETEAQLAKRARDAYRAFRRENFHTVLRVESTVPVAAGSADPEFLPQEREQDGRAHPISWACGTRSPPTACRWKR